MSEEYIILSHKYGTILSWFQAGGGNISVKENNILYIKQSGTAVCDAKYVECDINKLLTNLSNSEDNFNDAVVSGGIPSIEVWFHTFTKKYTIHMHPCELCEILCSEKIPDYILNNSNYLIIPYINPGKELSKEIYKKYNNQSVIFLINHGVIFTFGKKQS